MTESINKNNTIIDLDNILKEAENITLDSLDFNKTFKEQEQILCEIKHMLSKNHTNNDTNNDNIPFTCNPIISKKLNDKSFNKLYQKFKIQNNLLSSNIYTPSRIKIKLSKKHKRRKLKSKDSHSKSKTKTKNKKKISTYTPKKLTKYKLNTRYPIVIIKKRTPRKNVIYLNK